MGRHTKAVSGRSRLTRASALMAVWVGGLVAGFFALLSVAARFTSCSTTARGLACRPAGTAIGAVLVLGVVATVTTATLLTHGRGPGRVAAWGVLGLAVLGAWYLAAHALLDSA